MLTSRRVVHTQSLKGNIMALSSNESKLISSMSDVGFDFATSLHAVAYKSVSKAFCDKKDAGEFAAAVFKACPTYAQKPLASWFRRHGLNVTTATVVADTTIGGPLDYKKSDYHIRGAKADCNILPLVQTHVVRKTVKGKEYTGTLQEQAAQEIEKLVKRVSADKTRHNAKDVAAVINAKLNGKAPVEKVQAEFTLTGKAGDSYDVSPEEFELLLAFLTKRQEIVAGMMHIEPLKLAA
jgi:hypothetical protein